MYNQSSLNRQECEQLRKAIMKNNGMKKNISKRLRHNEKEAENFRDELGDKYIWVLEILVLSIHGF